MEVQCVLQAEKKHKSNKDKVKGGGVMGNGMTEEATKVLKYSSPNYQEGYKDGYDDCNQEWQRRVEALCKTMDNLEAFRTFASTITVNFKEVE